MAPVPLPPTTARVPASTVVAEVPLTGMASAPNMVPATPAPLPVVVAEARHRVAAWWLATFSLPRSRLVRQSQRLSWFCLRSGRRRPSACSLVVEPRRSWLAVSSFVGDPQGAAPLLALSAPFFRLSGGRGEGGRQLGRGGTEAVGGGVGGWCGTAFEVMAPPPPLPSPEFVPDGVCESRTEPPDKRGQLRGNLCTFGVAVGLLLSEGDIIYQVPINACIAQCQVGSLFWKLAYYERMRVSDLHDLHGAK